jgi:D-alanyl-D-alanine dipeptidase
MEETEALRVRPARFVLSCVVVAALCATAFSRPLSMPDSLRPAELVELTRIDTTIRLDIRYATPRNFTGQVVYSEARAFLQRPAAEALLRVQAHLRATGYGLVIFDGYRPLSVTKIFWQVTPRSKRKFVANPAKGSKHNRGCAVDCSLIVRSTGEEVAMPSQYDEFSERAAAYFPGGTEAERRARDMLRKVMEREGFVVNPDEWWHFDYKDWTLYPILDIPFSRIP